MSCPFRETSLVKLGVSQEPAQRLRIIITEEPYTTVAVSRRLPSRWARWTRRWELLKRSWPQRQCRVSQLRLGAAAFSPSRSKQAGQAVAGSRRRWWRLGRVRGAGRGGRRFLVLLLGYGRPCVLQRQVPRPIQVIDRVWTSLLCGRDAFPQCKLCS